MGMFSPYVYPSLVNVVALNCILLYGGVQRASELAGIGGENGGRHTLPNQVADSIGLCGAY